MQTHQFSNKCASFFFSVSFSVNFQAQSQIHLFIFFLAGRGKRRQVKMHKMQWTWYKEGNSKMPRSQLYTKLPRMSHVFKLNYTNWRIYNDMRDNDVATLMNASYFCIDLPYLPLIHSSSVAIVRKDVTMATTSNLRRSSVSSNTHFILAIKDW